MSRRKRDQVDPVLLTEDVVKDEKAVSVEALRLLDLHRAFFHSTSKKDCRLCRSFRRTVLGGLSK